MARHRINDDEGMHWFDNDEEYKKYKSRIGCSKKFSYLFLGLVSFSLCVEVAEKEGILNHDIKETSVKDKKTTRMNISTNLNNQSEEIEDIESENSLEIESTIEPSNTNNIIYGPTHNKSNSGGYEESYPEKSNLREMRVTSTKDGKVRMVMEDNHKTNYDNNEESYSDDSKLRKLRITSSEDGKTKVVMEE